MIARAPPTERSTLTGRTSARMSAVLAGDRPGLRGTFAFAGPAVIASIAYLDPGNYATDIQAGSAYGDALLWVVMLANGIAMLFQALAAKLGIVTGRNLAELSREHFPRAVVPAMWLVSEVAAMATDLAEFLGGAIALSLLGGIPLFAGMVLTGLATYALLGLERRGFRPMELAIAACVGLIGLCYLVELAVLPVDWPAALRGTVVPRLPDASAVTIAVGIVGATVMPHAIYLHSGLTQSRAPRTDDRARRAVLRFSHREVVAALTVAGAINLAMVVVAAALLHPAPHGVADIDTAYRTLTPLLGGGAALVFLVSLLASGVSSSVVGTVAGQMIMAGFTRRRIPIALRRLLTMGPAFAVVAAGVNPTEALILSQVVLSFALPVPMVALLRLLGREDVMGTFRNGAALQLIAGAGVAAVVVLNALLLLQLFGLAPAL